MKYLELHPKPVERFAQRSLDDPEFLAAMRRGELDKLDELEKATIRVTDKITGKTVRHIFEGEINSSGRAVGCHHTNAINSGHSRLRPGEPITPGPDGLYRAKVDVKDANGNWIQKNAESTFFPDNWSKDRILEEISDAFRNPNKITIGNKWEAISPSGIKIGGYLDPHGNIATAFPIF